MDHRSSRRAVRLVQYHVTVLSVGRVSGRHPHDVRNDAVGRNLLGQHQVAGVDQAEHVRRTVLHAVGFDHVDRRPVLGVGEEPHQQHHDDRQRDQRFEVERVPSAPKDGLPLPGAGVGRHLRTVLFVLRTRSPTSYRRRSPPAFGSGAPSGRGTGVGILSLILALFALVDVRFVVGVAARTLGVGHRARFGPAPHNSSSRRVGKPSRALVGSPHR